METLFPENFSSSDGNLKSFPGEFYSSVNESLQSLQSPMKSCETLTSDTLSKLKSFIFDENGLVKTYSEKTSPEEISTLFQQVKLMKELVNISEETTGLNSPTGPPTILSGRFSATHYGRNG